MAMKTKKQRKQKCFDGMESEENRIVRELAEAYMEYHDHRMVVLKEEIEAADKLLEAMRAMKLTEIQMDGLRVELVCGKDKVKVKRSESESEAESDGTEDEN